MKVKDFLLNLLFKVKPLYKLFVFIDYMIRYKKIPKSIKLTDKRYFVRIHDNLLGFYCDQFVQYEIIEEIIIT